MANLQLSTSPWGDTIGTALNIHYMSGHSKWNNIKNRKGAVDTQRASVFNRLAKQIRIAVKEGKSGDPKSNASLRMLLDKARQANMPNAKIQKAIDTGLGKGAAGAINEIVYEGFGPGGVGLLVVVHTDNANRTSSEIKFIFSLGSPGSAMYLFKRQGDEYETIMPIPVDDPQTLTQVQELIDVLLENDDVEDVFAAVEGLNSSDQDSEPVTT